MSEPPSGDHSHPHPEEGGRGSHGNPPTALPPAVEAIRKSLEAAQDAAKLRASGGGEGRKSGGGPAVTVLAPPPPPPPPAQEKRKSDAKPKGKDKDDYGITSIPVAGGKGKERGDQKALRRPKKIYENSYRLQSHTPYSRDKVQKVLETTVDDMMEGIYYSAESSNDLAVKIAEKIRSRVLSLKFDRYKIIVMTNVGPLNRQGIHVGFRCLWDEARDTYNAYTGKSFNAFCTAVVYAIYYE